MVTPRVAALGSLREETPDTLAGMAEDLRLLDNWVRADRWPQVACPACRAGYLETDGIDSVASAKTDREFRATGRPTELAGTFSGLLRCSIPACRETVTVAGEYCVGADADDDGMTREFSYHQLRFALPALRIIWPPPRTPAPVVQAIESAAAVIWLDPSAAANRLRVAIEEVLTHYGMPRFQILNGKRRRLSTHERITEFRKYEGVADSLEAVKWIGNQGSHESALSATDVLDGAELLNYALKGLYDTSDNEIQRRIRDVNKRRGLPRKRKS